MLSLSKMSESVNMKLSDLIKTNKDFFEENVLDYTLSIVNSTEDIEVPDEVLMVINKLKNGDSINISEFNTFDDFIGQQNKDVKNSLSLL